MTIEILHRSPTVDEYLELARSVGWEHYVSAETARVALSNSMFSVVAWSDAGVIGTARIIGDGALFFYIQDVIVHPNVQGSGVGGKLMDELMIWLRGSAPQGATVGLFAAEGKGPFYEKYGFKSRPDNRPGMDLEIGAI